MNKPKFQPRSLAIALVIILHGGTHRKTTVSLLTPALLSPFVDGDQHLQIQPLGSLQFYLLDNMRQFLSLLLERRGPNIFLIDQN